LPRKVIGGWQNRFCCPTPIITGYYRHWATEFCPGAITFDGCK
jgi:hypothetical protein